MSILGTDWTTVLSGVVMVHGPGLWSPTFGFQSLSGKVRLIHGTGGGPAGEPA